jgi:hypothetical protein
MKLLQLIEYLRKHLKGVVFACYGVLGLLVVIDVVLHLSEKHGEAAAETAGEHAANGVARLHQIAETMPGFWSVFGFIACTLIIFLSKWYGHAGIMKREDYYDE